MAESKYGKYIITELNAPFDAAAATAYAQWATRILWIDDKVVPGAFQMNVSWYRKPNDTLMAAPHRHDCDELIGFLGSNPDEPKDMGGEVEFRLEDEKHVITQSCLIFVPKGMKRSPLIITRVDRPILHFSIVMSGRYAPTSCD